MTLDTIIVLTLFLAYAIMVGYFLSKYDVIIKKLRFLLRPKESDMSCYNSPIDYSIFDFNEARSAPETAVKVSLGVPDIRPVPWQSRRDTDWEMVSTPDGRLFWVRQYEGKTEITEIPNPERVGIDFPKEIKINAVVESKFKFDKIDLSGL